VAEGVREREISMELKTKIMALIEEGWDRNRPPGGVGTTDRRPSGVGTIGHGGARLAVVAYLPRLGHDTLGDFLLAQHLGDQTLPEIVGAHVGCQLYGISLHRFSVLLSGIALSRSTFPSR
jgi:hypothetical protein